MSLANTETNDFEKYELSISHAKNEQLTLLAESCTRWSTRQPYLLY